MSNLSKLKEIFTAWGISFDPSDTQSLHAARRLSICNKCEFKSDSPIRHCTVCGCPLKSKVYSQSEGACPKGKWDETDTIYFLDN